MRAAMVVAFAFAAGALNSAAAAILRCEWPDGRVVYSNAECPAGTKLVRKIEQSPPVVVHEGASLQAPAREPLPPAKVERSRPKPPADPNQEDRQLDEQLAAQRRECAARLREIEQLRQDMVAAPDETRASAELTLRRAQDDQRALCPRQR